MILDANERSILREILRRADAEDERAPKLAPSTPDPAPVWCDARFYARRREALTREGNASGAGLAGRFEQIENERAHASGALCSCCRPVDAPGALCACCTPEDRTREAYSRAAHYARPAREDTGLRARLAAQEGAPNE